MRPPSRSANADDDTRRAGFAAARVARSATRTLLRVRADPTLTYVSLPSLSVALPLRSKLGPGTGESVKITFLGANGQEAVVECPEDQYILDAAIDAGLELPYTCRGGICGACIAKCVEGPSGIDHRDITDLEFTLDEEEQADGLALLCMCYPVGDITLETQSDWGMRVGSGRAPRGDRWTRTHQADGRRAQGTLISRALPGGLGAESERRTKPARVPRCMNT